MEKTNEKVTSPPPPAYNEDSDIESIIKPEKSAFEDTAPKPVPAWTWRSKRLQLIFAGVVSAIVIVAITLGVLASQNILIKKPKHQQLVNANLGTFWFTNIPADCTKVIYRNVPGAPPNKSTRADDSTNVWCAQTASGITIGIQPFPEKDWQCTGWYTDHTVNEVNQAYHNEKQLTWNCFDWQFNNQTDIPTNTGIIVVNPSVANDGSFATSTSVTVFTAGGVMPSVGGYLSGVALIASFLMAVAL